MGDSDVRRDSDDRSVLAGGDLPVREPQTARRSGRGVRFYFRTDLPEDEDNRHPGGEFSERGRVGEQHDQ